MEVDYEYDKADFFKSKYARYLPFVITTIPDEYTNEGFEKEKEFFKQYDHKKIIEWLPTWNSNGKPNIYIYVGIWAFFTLLMPLIISIDEKKLISLNGYIIYFILGIPFIYLTYKAWKRWKNAPESKYVTCDRLNSFITMPKLNEHDTRTIPFNNLRAVITRVQVGRHGVSGLQLHFINETFRPWPWKPNFLTMSIYNNGIYGEWSFYVWYMDKNRPLPPGPVFDEFREKDFERRKADGFPPPLFKSLIPTPEATPAQQLVREAFWKDEDYVATENETAYSLSPFSKRYKGMTGEKVK